MPLINCEMNFQIKWSKIVFGRGYCSKSIASIYNNLCKTFIPVETLSTQDNVRLLKQLESGFERISNWNKHQSKTTTQVQKRYLGFLTDPSSQGVNIFII